MADCRHPVWRLIHRLDEKNEDTRGALGVLLRWGLTGALSAIAFGIQDGAAGVLAGLTMAAVLCAVDLVVHRPEVLRKPFAAYAPVIVFLAVLYFAPEKTDSVAFYNAVSQIIPVLFLAWILDARALADRLPVFRRAALVTVFFLALAGYQSLRVIVADDAEVGSFSLVVAALVSSVAGLILVALAPPEADQPRSTAE